MPYRMIVLRDKDTGYCTVVKHDLRPGVAQELVKGLKERGFQVKALEQSGKHGSEDPPACPSCVQDALREVTVPSMERWEK